MAHQGVDHSILSIDWRDARLKSAGLYNTGIRAPMYGRSSRIRMLLVMQCAQATTMALAVVVHEPGGDICPVNVAI